MVPLALNVGKLLEDYKRMCGAKSTILNVWQQIGEFCYPNSQNFLRYTANDGDKRRRSIFDPTAEFSLDIFASSVVAYLANPATKWINFQPSNTELLNDRDVQLFVDDAQRKSLAVFNNPRSKFYDNLFTMIKMVGAFGNAALLMDKDKDAIVKFKAESPKAFDFTEDFSGNTKDVYFEKEYTIGALRAKAETDKWNIPGELAQRAEHEKVKVLRVIMPNPAYDNTKLGFNFAKYHSYHVLPELKAVLKEGYFNISPIAICRWDRVEDEKWADSPGRVALSTIKLVNAADRGMIVAMEKELNPTLAISSEAKYGKLDTSAGAVLVGRGNPNDTIREIRTTGNNIRTVFDWMEFKRQQIRTAFYVDVFQTAQQLGMTATEADIRNQERLRGIAPKISKMQDDVIGFAGEKVLEALIERGEVVVPEVLKEEGGEIRVVYLSPIAQAQRFADGQGIAGFLNDIGIAAQAQAATGQKPEIMDLVDFDKLGREMAEIRGVPERILRSEDDYMGLREQRAQAEQAQAAAMMAAQAATQQQPAAVNG